MIAKISTLFLLGFTTFSLAYNAPKDGQGDLVGRDVLIDAGKGIEAIEIRGKPKPKTHHHNSKTHHHKPKTHHHKPKTHHHKSKTHHPKPTKTSSTVPTPTGYTLVGCVNGGYLEGPQFSNSSNSVEFCASFCSLYPYYAVENGNQCSCGNSPANTTPNGGCFTTCSGNPNEICGGFGSADLYYDSSKTPLPPPVVNGFTFQGCFNGGVLNGPNFSNASNSLEFCASYCSSFPIFSVENGNSCSCGTSTGTLTSAPGACHSACAAAPQETCGGFGYKDIYEK